MQLSTRTKIIVVAAYTAVVFSSGAYLSPKKITEETKVEDKTKETTNVVVDTNVDHKDALNKTIIHTKVKHPDGTIESRTEIIENRNQDSSTNTKSSTVDAKQETLSEEKTKVVESQSGQTSISVFVNENLTSVSAPSYGVHVQREILGPISIGVMGTTAGNVGASVGLRF